jgi:PAS domain S-box-containing protein
LNTNNEKIIGGNRKRTTSFLNKNVKNLQAGICRPLRILAMLTVISGLFAMMFEVQYFQEFSVQIYIARLLATIISFIIFGLTLTRIGKAHPTLLSHLLLVSIICSFVFLIILLPDTLFLNSHILSLLIFTTALFLSWDIKNQIIVAIYYNVLFASSIFLADNSVYYLPNMYAAVLFVMVMSLLSIIAVSVNYKLKQEALIKSFELSELFNKMPEGIFRCKPDGTLITMNNALINILGFSLNKDLEKIYKLNDLFNVDEEFTKFSKTLKENEKVCDFNTKLIKADGSTFTACINTWLSHGQNNNIEFFEGTISDITEKEKVDLKIHEYNKNLKKINASKDKFFSIVAHDLKTPFTALMGYTEIIENESDHMSREEIKEFATSMNDVAKNTFNLLQNLLDWSRIQTGRINFEPDYFNLYELSQQVILLLGANASIKSIKLVNEISTDLHPYADKNMIYTVLRNLISNAIKFTEKYGIIKIIAEENGEFCNIIVQDPGIGMTEDELDKLFKVESHFSQTGTANETGTGLGLILCNELVKKNGGKFYVESEKGKGSKFIFHLKLKNDLSSDTNNEVQNDLQKPRNKELAEQG